jgi:CheY-like chemotaxis protein
MVAVTKRAAPQAATVLVTEDEPDIRDLISAFLGGLGYRVLAAADAAEALRLLEAHGEIALLLTDVTLPGGTTGFALAREAQRQRPELKVIYASGHARGRERPAPHELLGPLLAKPFRLAELQRQIETALQA